MLVVEIRYEIEGPNASLLETVKEFTDSRAILTNTLNHNSYSSRFRPNAEMIHRRLSCKKCDTEGR